MPRRGSKQDEPQQPAADEGGSEEYTTTSSSSEGDDGDAGGEGSLFGSCKTRLRWETAAKTLHLDVRQYLQNRRKLELKYKGRLDTSSGRYTHTAQLQRLMSQNTPSLARVMAAERGFVLDGEQEINPTQFLPAGLKTLLFKDWNLAPGVRFATAGRAALPAAAGAGAGEPAAAVAVLPDAGGSGSSDGPSALRYCLTLRKQPQVLIRRSPWDSWVDGKLDVEVDSAQQAVGLRAAARLTILRLNVTDRQDVQLAVGCDYITDDHSAAALLSSSVRRGDAAAADGKGGSGSSLTRGVLTPYFRLSENSWALRLSKGSLAFTYEM